MFSAALVAACPVLALLSGAAKPSSSGEAHRLDWRPYRVQIVEQVVNFIHAEVMPATKDVTKETLQLAELLRLKKLKVRFSNRSRYFSQVSSARCSRKDK